MLLFQTVALAADDKACISVDQARTLATEIDYCADTVKSNNKVIANLKEQNKNYFTLSETYKEKLLLVEKDKDILRERGDGFEKEYKGCSGKLGECLSKKPSRLTWFGIGFVTAAVLGTAAVIAIK